jgi:DNA-binding NarL/FixJ family response regulator
METIKYIIADDHSIFRKGLQLVLSGDKQLQCIGEANNGKELLKLLKENKPDVVLLDIKMPDMDGIAALDEIKVRHHQLKTIIITMYEDEQFLLHFIKKGANGYLTKDADPQEIKNAIHSVHNTGFYFNDQTSNTMLKALVKKNTTPANDNKLATLTAREMEVLKLLCKEYTATEIGKELFLSARTIEGIKSAMIEKLGTRNTVGLIVYALKNGIE